MVKLRATLYITESMETSSVENVATEMKRWSFPAYIPVLYLNPQQNHKILHNILDLRSSQRWVWRFTSSGILHRVDYTDVSNYRRTFTFRIQESSIVSLGRLTSILLVTCCIYEHAKRKFKKRLGLICISIHHFPDSRPHFTDRTVTADRLHSKRINYLQFVCKMFLY